MVSFDERGEYYVQASEKRSKEKVEKDKRNMKEKEIINTCP